MNNYREKYLKYKYKYINNIKGGTPFQRDSVLDNNLYDDKIEEKTLYGSKLLQISIANSTNKYGVVDMIKTTTENTEKENKKGKEQKKETDQVKEKYQVKETEQKKETETEQVKKEQETKEKKRKQLEYQQTMLARIIQEKQKNAKDRDIIERTKQTKETHPTGIIPRRMPVKGPVIEYDESEAETETETASSTDDILELGMSTFTSRNKPILDKIFKLLQLGQLFDVNINVILTSKLSIMNEYKRHVSNLQLNELNQRYYIKYLTDRLKVIWNGDTDKQEQALDLLKKIKVNSGERSSDGNKAGVDFNF